MKTAATLQAVGCLALLSAGTPAAAGPGDRVERYPPRVCTDCGSEIAAATAADRDTCNGNRQTNADTALACEAVLLVP